MRARDRQFSSQVGIESRMKQPLAHIQSESGRGKEWEREKERDSRVGGDDGDERKGNESKGQTVQFLSCH